MQRPCAGGRIGPRRWLTAARQAVLICLRVARRGAALRAWPLNEARVKAAAAAGARAAQAMDIFTGVTLGFDPVRWLTMRREAASRPSCEVSRYRCTGPSVELAKGKSPRYTPAPIQRCCRGSQQACCAAEGVKTCVPITSRKCSAASPPALDDQLTECR